MRKIIEKKNRTECER